MVLPFDPAGASQPMDDQEINTHRHVRHPFNDRVLHFLRRLAPNITEIESSRKGKSRIREKGFPCSQPEMVFRLQLQLRVTE